MQNKKETFYLITGNSKRKMSFIEKDNKLLMMTKADSKKVNEINKNNIVTTDINDSEYIATISTDIKLMTEIKTEMLESFSKVHKVVINKMYKLDDSRVAIILEKK